MTNMTGKLNRLQTLCFSALALAALWPAGAHAQPAAPFYKGKQIRMVIPSGAGGGYDTYARILSQHLVKHIPGNPVIIDQNMPGASGMLGTNWAASIAPKDGTVIVSTYNTLLLEPLFGNASVKYDPRDFEWIGSMGKQTQICATWHTSPVKTIEQAKTREIIVAATGATGNSAIMPKQLNALLGTKFKVVPGYSTTESRLAVERGEAEGVCGLSLSTLKASNPDWIINNRINVLVQTGESPQEGLEKVPLLKDLVQGEEDKVVLDMLGVPEEMGRPFLMPPGTPKHLVEIMRRAFDATMKDPAFLADAEKARLELGPITGEEMDKMIRRAYSTPKNVLQRAAQLSR
ncbi:MAG: tripartite tricarboxylate transporter substrate-binding protein [Beijerinckiaceae bacterium]|nr:tripartite tricarboxylate transporter substrate-binding protein [Beijerinckiaceae bacterium]